MKKVEGHEQYLIDKNGDCYSTKFGKFLKLKKRITNAGYVRYCLDKKEMSAHRLVAKAYIKNTHNKPQINHKDGNKKNNHYSNLEWCTAEENQQHSINKLGKNFDHRRGSMSNFSKLNEKDVLEIKKAFKGGNRYGLTRDLSKEYNISHGVISMIRSNKIWAHVKA